MNCCRSLITAAVFFLCLSNVSFPQINKRLPGMGCTIRGVIIDSLTNKPVEFGNFVLYRLKDSTLAEGAVSDKDGKFSVFAYRGAYFAKVSFIGYKSRKKNKIVIGGREEFLDMDTIRISPRSFTTGEVNVVAEKERVTREDDKLILMVDRAASNNALDALEDAPMINVDMTDGSITLLGRENAKVYIDGRPMQYSGYDKVEDLKMMHISEIERVELVPDPGFEFEDRPEGGVINIITRKIAANKYTAMTDIQGDTKNNLYSSAMFEYGLKGLSIRGQYNNSYSYLNTESNVSKVITINNSSKRLEQSGKSDNNKNSNFFALGINYNDNSKNTFSVRGNYRNVFADDLTNLMNSVSDDGAGSIENYYSNNSTNSRHKFLYLSTFYSRGFEKKDRMINAGFVYIRNSMDQHNDLLQNNISGAEGINGTTGAQKNYSDNTNYTESWNISYSDVLFGDARFRADYSGRLIKLSMDNIYTNLDQQDQVYIEDLRKRLFRGSEDTRHSITSYLSGNTAWFRYSLGLSFEKKIQTSEEKITKDKYSYEFTSLVPSAGIGRELWSGHQADLRFSWFPQYPQNRQLNPHVDYTDSTNLVMGNPDLEPSYMYMYTFRYSFPLQGQSISLGATYTTQKNVIEPITTQTDTKTALTTYMNIAARNSYQVSISTSRTFFDCLRLEPFFNVVKSSYNGHILNNDKVSMNGTLQTSLALGNFKMQVSYRYFSPSISYQSKSTPLSIVNAAFRGNFYDKKLALTLRVSDLFNTRNQNSDRYGTGFYMTNNIKQTTRIVSLDISYFFQSVSNDYLSEEPNRDMYDDDF